MACIEHQVLEIVRFVNEEVVDAHLSEICNIIRPILYILFQLFSVLKGNDSYFSLVIPFFLYLFSI